MNFAVIVFPGSSGENDVYYVLKKLLDKSVDYVWHENTDLDKYDAIILPSGTSYGDYIRPGAIARYSPVVKAIKEFAKNGGLVLGIGNGFQILLEMNLLPGALLKNENLKFACKDTYLKIENNNTPFTNHFEPNEVISMPIAHGYGNYFCDEATLKDLINNKQIILRYSDENGESSPLANINGALENIAGIINEAGNVCGMMPHPERSSEEILGGIDGLKVFTSIINSLKGVGV